MSKNIKLNGSLEFAGVNSGHVANVDVRGTWDGASIAVQTKSNGTYTTFASDGTQTANFNQYYQVGSENGVNVALTSNGASTDLEVDVTSYKPS